jgi:hypothetical protein
MRIDISDRQLNQDFEDIKTFCRFYHHLDQNYMQSFISFVLRFNLDFLSFLIILDEYRGIADKCALNRAANLLPGVLFVVELESYGKHDHFVNVYSDVPLLSQSLQLVCTTWCINFQCHCPYAYPKLIFSRNIYIVWSVNDQERGIGEAQPERSTRQVKQGAFTGLEVTFNRGLVK